MDLGSIFLILALLLLVGLFIARPFFSEQPVERTPLAKVSLASDQVDHERSALMAERDRILNAIQELDFDNTLGKIPEEDYPQQRAILMQRGADVLRKLDALQATGSELQEDTQERLEATIAARRMDIQSDKGQVSIPVGGNGKKPARGVSAALASPDDDLEVMLANRRRVRQEKAAGFCPQCGGPLQKSDRFCPKCGHKMA